MRYPEKVWRQIFEVFLEGDIVRTKDGRIARISSLSIGWDPVRYSLYELRTDKFLGWYYKEEISIARSGKI